MSFLRNSCRAGFRALGLTTLLVSAGMLADAQPIAYVANQDSNSVSVINTATNTVVATIPVGIRPWRLGVRPRNTILLGQ
jgi:YVTN family beta-propeller protein